MDELEIIKKDVEDLKAEVQEIRDNHLQCIFSAVMEFGAEVKSIQKQLHNLRWFIAGAGGIISIVIALIKCLG